MDRNMDIETDMENHVETYRRFVVVLRFVILAHVIAATIGYFTFFPSFGWPMGVAIGLVELALGFKLIRSLPAYG
jgi:uncharacterized membrane protein HdeD (DUF308 family)